MSRRAGWLGPSRARLSLLFAIALIADGCATSGPQPGTMEYKPYRERAETQAQGDLSVTVALPTAAEAADIYGADLAEKQIQPVWIEVRNDAAVPYWFLISGLDPNYFAASEAAHAFHATTADGADRALDERFDSLQFRNPVMPGATVSGFVLTNLDEGVKVVDVDLIARGDARSFTFVAVDPSFKATSLRVDFDKLYRSDELIHVDDEDELRTLLEQLPCCVTNADGTENGDPLNLVLVGDRADFLAALVRRQWHPTEIIWSGSLWRTVSAFIQGSRYRYSPISSLYLYGRPQDIAAQKARGSIHERNHARFWLSPIRFRGKEVYVGQISRDIGVKFTLKSPTISTHVIDPDIDESRRYLVEDLLYSQALNRIGHVKGVGASSKAEPRLNLMGDPYYTDGLRAVMFFEPRPYSLSQLDVLDWERVPSIRHTLQKVSVSRAGGTPMTGADGIGPQLSRAAMAAVGLALLLLTGACASPFERPAPLDDGPLRARAVTKTDDGIRVSAAVPSGDESRSIFGVDLDQRGIQPLWLEIENGSERSVYFLPTGLDPEYFAPLEVAFLYGGPFHDEGKAALAAHLEALSFDSRSPILPGETVSGFVYANRADPSMMVQVDLIGREWSDSIGLVVPVPGTEAAQQRMAALRGLYTESDVVEIDDEPALRSALEELPCCAADQTGARSLPLNLVLIGKLDEWGPAFVGRNYRYAPASPWHAFGRMQDLSGHRISRWVAPQPHTLRFWLTPLRYQGKPIWVGQVSTGLGGRFAASGEETQRIEPDVDDARNDIVQDLLYSQALAKVGFVKGAGSVSAAGPRPTSDAASYHTDGLRAVMLFDRRPVALSQIQFFDWERIVDPPGQTIEASTAP